MFRNNNPDKGTETVDDMDDDAFASAFRNNNPDERTETYAQLYIYSGRHSLEIITPMRGQ